MKTLLFLFKCIVLFCTTFTNVIANEWHTPTAIIKQDNDWSSRAIVVTQSKTNPLLHTLKICSSWYHSFGCNSEQGVRFLITRDIANGSYGNRLIASGASVTIDSRFHQKLTVCPVITDPLGKLVSIGDKCLTKNLFTNHPLPTNLNQGIVGGTPTGNATATLYAPQNPMGMKSLTNGGIRINSDCLPEQRISCVVLIYGYGYGYLGPTKTLLKFGFMKEITRSESPTTFLSEIYLSGDSLFQVHRKFSSILIELRRGRWYPNSNELVLSSGGASFVLQE